tara:strand:- start:47 stop:499 length:453 start_codon:yes stop_codon:yes gene_type:complete
MPKDYKKAPAKKKKKKLVIRESTPQEKEMDRKKKAPAKKKKKKLVIRESTPQEKEMDRKNQAKPNVFDIEDLEREGKNRLFDIQYDIASNETDAAYYSGMGESRAMEVGQSRAFQYMNDFIKSQMKGAKTNREVVNKINKLSTSDIYDLI